MPPWAMDLQYFAGEKTEKATPKKRRDARQKGQVFKSMDLSSAFVLVFVFLGLQVFGPGMLSRMTQTFQTALTHPEALGDPLTVSSAYAHGRAAVGTMLFLLAPLLLTVMTAGVLINYFQVGFLLTGKTMEFKFSRINPLEGLKRMISLKGLVQLTKSLLKVVIVGYTVYREFMNRLSAIPELMSQEIPLTFSFVAAGILAIAFRACIALAVLGVLDYLYQWWEHEKELRMTHQEVKDEYKQMEGDPQTRSRIREKQRQLGMRRMMQEVPAADVVVVNPVHYAVALKYDAAKGAAPIVVAKGQGLVAIKIREIAQENGVEIVENPPVARGLYQGAEIGEQIPYELYRAVAEILAFVYRKRNGLQ